MRNIEEELNNKKFELDNMKIPEELESTLRIALNSVEETGNNKSLKNMWIIRHKIIAAVFAVIVFFGAYNYDVFAYYGKKILGYDEVTVGSLKELNELGKGQEINKSYTFKNGTVVTLDGVMLDDNKLVAMYTIKGDSEEEIFNYTIQGIKGGLVSTYNPQSGAGKISEDKKEVKWVEDFEAPKAFDKNLVFNIICNSKGVSFGELGKIPFKLERNRAIQRTVKCSVNQTVDFQGIKYNFTTLSATPLSVVLEGKATGLAVESGKAGVGMESRRLNVELWETYVKDGKTITEEIQHTGGGMGSSMSGIEFHNEFDGLKAGVKKLTLKVVKLEDMKIIDRNIEVNLQTANVKVVPETEALIIKNVKKEGSNTIVTFTSERDVAFVTALDIEGKEAKTLEEASKIVQINGKECLEKTFKFEGSGEKMKLMFKSLTHESYINKEISLYEEKK